MIVDGFLFGFSATLGSAVAGVLIFVVLLGALNLSGRWWDR